MASEKVYPDVIDISQENRDGNTLQFLKIEDTENQYRLNDEAYMRFCRPDDYTDDIAWVDPSGGPMMKVGYELPGGLSIKSITFSEKYFIFHIV